MMIGIDGAINMALFIFVLYQFITYSLDISVNQSNTIRNASCGCTCCVTIEETEEVPSLELVPNTMSIGH